MLNNVTSIITTDIAVANNESRLSICLRSNGFSFSIIDSHDMLHTFADVDFDFNRPLGELSQSIKDLFSSINIVTFGMKEARLIIPSDNQVWVPQHLYDSTRDRQYLRLSSRLDSSLGVYHMQVPHLNSFTIFSANATVVTAFKIAVPGIDVCCQHSALITNQILEQSKNHPIMLMHVRDGVGDFEICFNGQLLLSNSFIASSQNELLYRAIGIMKQLHIETPDMELSICGQVGREIFGLLQHYFPNVTLYTGKKLNFQNSQFQTFPIYQHAMIMS